jgi:beta-galactosidase
VGNVTLQSRPRGTYVSDVYIQPSTRKKQLGLDVELSGVKQSGPVQLVASLVDEKGKVEKRFIQTVNATAGATQRVKVNWAWPNPRLWDYKQPNLYTLRLTAKGAGLDDEPAITFGFRETWIEGRQVIPQRHAVPHASDLDGNWRHGRRSGSIEEAFEMGFNFGEIWPEAPKSAAAPRVTPIGTKSPDRRGMPISGMTPHMGWMGGNMNNPAKQAAYRAAAERVLRRHRNHPSIIMWGTSGNMFGACVIPSMSGPSQRRGLSKSPRGTPTSAAMPLGEIGVSIIKSIDPTRLYSFTTAARWATSIRSTTISTSFLCKSAKNGFPIMS